MLLSTTTVIVSWILLQHACVGILVSHTGSPDCSTGTCSTLGAAVLNGYASITLEASVLPHLLTATLDVAGISLNCSDPSIDQASKRLAEAEFSADGVKRELSNLGFPDVLQPLSAGGKLCVLQPAAILQGIQSIRLSATAAPGSRISFTAHHIVFTGFIGQSSIQQGQSSARVTNSGSVLSVSGLATVTLESCIFLRNRAAPWAHQLSAQVPLSQNRLAFQRLRDLEYGAANVVERWGQATGSAVSVFYASSTQQHELWPGLRYQKMDVLSPLQQNTQSCRGLNALSALAEELTDRDLFPDSYLTSTYRESACDRYIGTTSPCGVLDEMQKGALSTSNLWEPISPECAKFVSMPTSEASADQAKVFINNTLFWGNAGQTASLLLHGAKADITDSAFMFNDGSFYQARGPYPGAAVNVAGNSTVSFVATRIAHNSATHGAGIVCLESSIQLHRVLCERNDAQISSACLAVGNFLSRTNDDAELPAPQIQRSCQAVIADSQFRSNVAQRGAVGAMGVFGHSHAAVSNSSFSNNFASVNGGVFVAWYSNFSCQACSFLNNTMSEPFDAGGAALAILDGSAANVTDSVFRHNNAANSGGAVGLYGASLALGTRRGFAFPSSGYFRGVLFDSNRAVSGRGGAIQVSRGSLQLDDCDFIGNSANQEGGAINVGISPDLRRWDFDVSNNIIHMHHSVL